MAGIVGDSVLNTFNVLIIKVRTVPSYELLVGMLTSLRVWTLLVDLVSILL